MLIPAVPLAFAAAVSAAAEPNLLEDCATGTASACEALKSASTGAGLLLALYERCADPPGCDPPARLGLATGPFRSIADLGPAAGPVYSLLPFEGGLWAIGSNWIQRMPDGGRPELLSTRPLSVAARADRGLLIYDARLDRLGVWRPAEGRVVPEGRPECSRFQGAWTTPPDCKVWTLGSRVVEPGPFGRADSVAAIGDALWVLRDDAIALHRPDRAVSVVAPGALFVAALGPNLAYVAGRTSLEARRTTDGSVAWTFAERDVQAALSPDGRWLAVGTVHALSLLDAQTGAVHGRTGLPCGAPTWTHDGNLLCGWNRLFRVTIGAGTAPSAGPLPPLVLPEGWPGPAPQ